MPADSILRSQYALTRETRLILFDYCSTISVEHFVTEVNGFGRGGSMRNLLVHIATTYQFWIGKFGLSKDIQFAEYKQFATIGDVAALFETIDELLNEFFERFEDKHDQWLNKK